jgi:hypothetical protein
VAGGTEVRLRHTGLPAGEPPLAHLAGWRHALATLAYAGSADQLAPVLGERVADWLAAWNEPDATRRAGLLGRCLADGGQFRDPTAAVDDAGPLADHIGTVQRPAGGARLVGRGAPEQCHGVIHFGWAAVGSGRGRPGHRDQRGRGRPGRAVPLGHRVLGPAAGPPWSVACSGSVEHPNGRSYPDPRSEKCDESVRSWPDFAHWQGTRQSLRTP